ncbi:hypothetical protein [Arvimicrobium flavum]|uniref:hypothetical protein n=1 Tax=Arvimicrobium flavum TaxID=3393320 RepID=UPI00237B64E1|nr:hypothetical protein [Mesorhizobium shangrilense]
MTTLQCDELIIGEIGGAGPHARLYLDQNFLVIKCFNGLAGVRIDCARVEVLGSDVEVRGSDRVRIEGAGIEIHGSAHVKLDAGGVGFTWTPTSWEGWYSSHGAAYRPAPPEHPLHGGTPYSWPSE